jgi:DNA-3-methyladenine glycosylase II
LKIKFEQLLIPPKEFRFKQTLGYLARTNNECLYKVKNETVYKLILLHEKKVLLSVSEAGENKLIIRFHCVIPEESIRMEAAQYVWDWFDLNRDLAPFYQLAETDPILQKLIEAHYGLRIVGIPDLFEALSWAIIGQQINLTFAYTLKTRFVETYGEHMEVDGNKYWLFPTPAKIAGLSVDELKGLQFSQKKAEYVLEVARRMEEGSLSKKKLSQLKSFSQIEQELVKIRGIGSWTANYVRMICFRDPTAFPIADVGLHNAVKQFFRLDQKPSIEELKKMFANWPNWEAYVTYYFWRTLY